MGLNITFQLGALPEAFSGNPQEFADLLVERLSAIVSGSFMTGQIGGVEPTNDIGLYVDKDNRRIKVWSDEDAEYKLVTEIPVGMISMWSSITPPEDWLICNGAVLQRDEYPELFSVIGTQWGTTTSDDFHLPKADGRAPFGVGTPQYAENGANGFPVRTDAGDTIQLGKLGLTGYDFMQYRYSLPSGQDATLRNQITPSSAAGFYNSVMPPLFGIYFIIKAR